MRVIFKPFWGFDPIYWPIVSFSFLRWLGSRLDDALHISTLTVVEFRRGMLETEPSRFRREFETCFADPEGPQGLFGGRVLAFNEWVALEWARLVADGTTACRSRCAIDMIIAAVAVAHGLPVATANEKHFRDTGIPWINPLPTVP
jgi:predicted nucleic acid-binding protein